MKVVILGRERSQYRVPSKLLLWATRAQSYWGTLGDNVEQAPKSGEGTGVFIHQLPPVKGGELFRKMMNWSTLSLLSSCISGI